MIGNNSSAFSQFLVKDQRVRLNNKIFFINIKIYSRNIKWYIHGT